MASGLMYYPYSASDQHDPQSEPPKFNNGVPINEPATFDGEYSLYSSGNPVQFWSPGPSDFGRSGYSGITGFTGGAGYPTVPYGVGDPVPSDTAGPLVVDAAAPIPAPPMTFHDPSELADISISAQGPHTLHIADGSVQLAGLRKRPNWFHRLMQGLIFGFKWTKNDTHTPLGG